ncbi:MAG: putative permease [Gammaproteobacteria bacterium]|jgi:putative permease
MKRITLWFKRQFNDPQVVFLTLALVTVLLVVLYAGNMLAPVLASIVIAYLLEGIIRLLQKLKVPRLLSVVIVFISFMLFILIIIFAFLPLLFNQSKEMVQNIPAMLSQGQEALLRLPERYPELFSEQQVSEMIDGIRTDLTEYGQEILTLSLSSVTGVISILIYFVLVPILVFFFLKDKRKIINWAQDFLPNDQQLAGKVWGDVDGKIGNYIRGKFWEILIVFAACIVTFTLLELQWALLLAVLVGLSVIIPYIGAAVVTIPVALVAWFQWGWSTPFMYLMVAYFIIQALDGNLLVPLLFSEVVNIHPIAIIVAILLFGGLWGLWGVFFAIPLATVVQAIITEWPREAEDESAQST